MPNPRNIFPDFKGEQNALNRFFSNLTKVVGVIATQHFTEGFRRGGFTDKVFEPWKPRKKADKEGKKRAILVDSGSLRRAIRVIESNTKRVVVGVTDIPYAKLHNEGGTITGTAQVRAHARRQRSKNRVGKAVNVRSHTRKLNIKIPARPFIKDSWVLDQRIENYITTQLKRIL